MKATLIQHYNHSPIVFTVDGWINATKTCQHFGKDVRTYTRGKSFREYVAALKRKINCAKSAQFVKTIEGREGGTYLHPKLAIDFARWISADFAVWCDDVIENILSGKLNGLSHLQSLILNKPKDWVKTFPDFLYEQMYRLQGQSFDKRKNKQSWVGHWTNKYIYRTLDKQLVKELKEARSKSKAKTDGAFLHQYLADDASDALRSHIEQIYGMMRAAKDADHFDSLWRQAFEHKDQLSLLMR